ncbi:MAG: hypothetical protein WA918_10340 [Erythrobacter sp.]
MPRQPHIALRLFTLFAALAAVLQWSIPQGWMIGTNAQGYAALTPCPETAPELAALAQHVSASAHAHHASPRELAHAHHGMDQSDEDAGAGSGQSLCDQVALGAPVLPPQVPAAASLLPVGILIPEGRPSAAPGRGLAAPPPFSTGPPILKV